MIPYPKIDPVAVSFGPFNIFGHSLGPLEIHWYGLMYLVGFVGSWWLGLRRAKRPDIGWTRQQVEDLIFYGAFGVILGGRIGYVLFYNLPVFMAHPITIFYVWEGGMSFHGGLLGVAVAFYIFARKYGFTYFQVSDFIAPMVPIGLGAGRIGNFINHELWGRPMVHVMPWAFDYGDHIPRHPSSLYQALTNGLLLFIILWWYSSKPRPRMAVTAVFMFGYGCFRFTTEFFRTPDAQLGFIAFHWLTMGQLLSIPMIIVGIVLFWLAMRSSNKTETGKA